MQEFTKIKFYKLLNLSLRAGGMGSKFLVAILLSKYFGKLDYKDYTLITTTITIAIYLLGIDFYNYSIRNVLIKTDTIAIKDKLKSVFVLYFTIYLVFSILSWSFFKQTPYIKPYFWVIVFLGITEHLSQEIYRILIAFNQVLRANFILAFRTVSWVIIILYKLFYKQKVDLELILFYWLFANILSVLYVMLYVFIKYPNAVKTSNINLSWIKKGIRVAAVFFIGTILLKTIEYSNRYIIDYFMEDVYVGIYGFYSSIAIIVTVYINTIVISFELPALIASSNSEKIQSKFIQFKQSLQRQSFVIIGILSLLIYPLLKWQNKIEYINHLPVFFILIVSVFFMNYSLAEHFKLYILHKDKEILKILIISGFFSFLSAVVFTAFLGVYGTSVSFLLTAIMLYWLRFKEASKYSF